MYTSKYRPKKIEDFVGNKEAIHQFIKWLLEWDINDNKNKCGLISGLCGIGKTILVELILKKHDYNIINITLNNSRNKDYMTNNIKFDFNELPNELKHILFKFIQIHIKTLKEENSLTESREV